MSPETDTTHPRARRDPAWWERLADDLAGESPASERDDPRVVGAELGLLPALEHLGTPPLREDFLNLAAALRAERAAPAHVRMGADRRGRPACMFRFPFDEPLNLAVKRLPGRSFNWDTREWAVPCLPDTVEQIAELLACFPRIVVAPAVSAWLWVASGWRGLVAAWDDGHGPVLALRSLAGAPPASLAGRALEQRDDLLLLPLDLDVARRVEELDELELDDVAAEALADTLAGRTPSGATLGLATDDDGVDRFALTVDTRIDAAAAFRRLSEVRGIGMREGRFAMREQAELLAVPADAALLDELDDFLEGRDGVQVTPEADRRREELRAERRRSKATVALSLAEDAELDLPALAGELRPFQRAGVRYALAQRRTFLADEQGLGKTVQALAAIEADDAYPAVVVCPASLKLTWAREAAHWLPHRSVAVLSGRSARGWAAAGAGRADIVVLNYEVVDGHLEALGAREPRAAVFDESHYCKEPRARRTKACLALAKRVRKDGLRLALTGTPIINRPKELVSQLRLIGRLGDFGSGAALTRRFRGPAALERLHWHLRAHCYVRRLKADVLPQLPPKRLVTIPVALDNEVEYRLAERNLIAWLRQQPLDLRTLEAKVAAAMRNERLVQLNRLRQLAGEGKLAASLAWIDDFIASGEPLVVFADHVEVQQALLERLPEAVHVMGDDSASARDDAVTAFQRPDGPQVIVCSMRAAGHGLTLTRASNVAFLELDWTPARLAQAEDRCHRIGQANAVTAWYLLAPDTIDETMAELLEHKRGVIGAVTDGRYVEGESLVEGVIRDLRERAEDGPDEEARAA